MEIGQQNLAFGAKLKIQKELGPHLNTINVYAHAFKCIKDEFERQTEATPGTMVIMKMDNDKIKQVGFIKPGEKEIHSNTFILKRNAPALHEHFSLVAEDLKKCLKKLSKDSERKTISEKIWNENLI